MSHDDRFFDDQNPADSAAADEFNESHLRDQVRSHYSEVRPSDAFLTRVQSIPFRRRPPRGRGWAVLGTVAAVTATTALIVAIPRIAADAPPADHPEPVVSTSSSTTAPIPVAPEPSIASVENVAVTTDSPAPSSVASQSTASSTPSSSVTDPGAVTGQAWQSPSGNLRCTTGGVDLVTCVATSIEFAGPAECPTGPIAVSLPRGGLDRTLTCAATIPVESAQLAYGESINDQGITCTSSESGMTCADSTDGRTFTLSKAGLDNTGSGAEIPGSALEITPEGLGEFRLGMTVDEVRATNPEFSPPPAEESVLGGPGCRGAQLNGVYLYFNPDGGLALVSAGDGVPVRTPEGLATGDTADKILQVYGDRVSVRGSGSGSWIAVTLDDAAGLEYWIMTDFRGDAINGDNPYTADAKVTSMSLNRDQMCVS